MLIAKRMLLILLLIFLQPVHAQKIDDYALTNVNVTFDIQSDYSVVQTNRFLFTSVINVSSINYTLAGTPSNILVSDDTQQLNYELVNDTNILRIFPKGATRTLTIIYKTSDSVSKIDSVYHFFSQFSFGRDIWTMSVQVKLPPNYGLYQNSYSPPDANIVSDGERIIVRWEKSRITNPAFSVKFTNIQQTDPWFILMLLLSGSIVFLYFYFRQRTKEEFIRGFREDEKKTIEYIEQKKTVLQSDLQKEFRFSRAKVTRIVSRLEEKGLIRKKKYGRTNKLYWLK